MPALSTSLRANGMGRAVATEPGLDIVPDSEQRGLIGALPAALRPYASLIRLDRPIGAWLLFWPCAWSVMLAGAGRAGWVLILWLALGAWAMRSAGCVYNDIVDRDLDAKVERTRLRPLASKRVSPGAAWALLVAMSLIGLVVLLQLNPVAALGLWAASLHLVRSEWFALLALLPVALHLAWQAASLAPGDGEDALAKFRSNRTAGLLMFLACLVVGNS